MPAIATRDGKIKLTFDQVLAIADQLSPKEKVVLANKMLSDRKSRHQYFDLAIKHSQQHFRKWLQDHDYDPENLTDEEVEKIIDRA
ncbi:MAG: hypothetical protein QME81_19420 [bacterium]|nr:hypothetical protein [bacterium]